MEQDEIEHVLVELEKLIAEGDASALDLANMLKAALSGTAVANDVRELSALLRDYAFEEAREALNRVASGLELG